MNDESLKPSWTEATTPGSPEAKRHQTAAASVSSRFIAWLLDRVYLGVCLGLSFVTVGATGQNAAAAFSWPVYLLVGGFFGVQWFLISATGQSLGKRSVGIQITRMDGGPVSFWSAVVLREWLMVPLYMIPFFALIDWMIIFGDPPRCVHDLIAKTQVIAVRKNTSPFPLSKHRWPLLAGFGTPAAVLGLGFALSQVPDTPSQAMVVGQRPVPAVNQSHTLAELHRTQPTDITFPTDKSPAPQPPAGIFEKVFYAAPLGENVAYITPLRQARGPAIVWIAGGFDWGLNASFWHPAPRDDDQSARAFREAGIALMLPSLRGSHDNPGQNQCFYGEVEDVIAAADYLATRSDVDPERIYLGGHSTGGTLALLVAASTDRFRGVFAFGPVAEIYHGECLPDNATPADIHARSPVAFVSDIRTPTFVIEGSESPNAQHFPPLQEAASSRVTFLLVNGADHFNVLAPATEVLAQAVLDDTVDAEHLNPAMLEHAWNRDSAP